MAWMQQQLRMWLGVAKLEQEIHDLQLALRNQELMLSAQLDRTASPEEHDPRDIPMEDTPDAHLGAL